MILQRLIQITFRLGYLNDVGIVIAGWIDIVTIKGDGHAPQDIE
jgi:hypothetical protein